MGTEQQAGNPEDASKGGFSSAEDARELIEMPVWKESDQSANQAPGPKYEFPAPNAERDAQHERELAESFRVDMIVAVPRNPDEKHAEVWPDYSGWKVVGSDGNKVLVEKPEADSYTSTKSVDASELVRWQPVLNPHDSLSIPSDDPNKREWTVVSQAKNREVRIVSNYSTASGKTVIKNISAIEAAKYRV